MGREATCSLRYGGLTDHGKAQLESDTLLFRGDRFRGRDRLSIPFADMQAVSAQDGKLTFRHHGKAAEILLGPQAPKWADAILNPKSRLEKLGIAPGMTVAILGDAPADFLAEIPAQAASSAAGLRIFFATSPRDLKRVNSRLAPLWIVYPKGQKEITQAEVIAVGRAAGLVDVKVMAFSPTHTALKFTLPKT